MSGRPKRRLGLWKWDDAPWSHSARSDIVFFPRGQWRVSTCKHESHVGGGHMLRHVKIKHKTWCLQHDSALKIYIFGCSFHHFLSLSISFLWKFPFLNRTIRPFTNFTNKTPSSFDLFRRMRGGCQVCHLQLNAKRSVASVAGIGVTRADPG